MKLAVIVTSITFMAYHAPWLTLTFAALGCAAWIIGG